MKNRITKIEFAVFIVAMAALMAIPAICRYKACGIAATGGEMFLALAITAVYCVSEERRKENEHHN